MERDQDQDHDQDYGDANAPIYFPVNRFKHLAFTPTALNSGAQRRAVPCEAFRRSMVAHAGSPIAPMIEPQRGSTNHIQYTMGLIRYFMVNLLN